MIITTKILAKLSLIINKMEISKLVLDLNVETGNEGADKEELVKKLLSLVIDNFYKAEKEITELVAELKGISYEEAEKEDIIEIIKDLFKDDKIRNFLKLT